MNYETDNRKNQHSFPFADAGFDLCNLSSPAPNGGPFWPTRLCSLSGGAADYYYLSLYHGQSSGQPPLYPLFLREKPDCSRIDLDGAGWGPAISSPPICLGFPIQVLAGAGDWAHQRQGYQHRGSFLPRKGTDPDDGVAGLF